MKSKQIRFFMLPTDYVEIDKYLADNHILVSALPLIENKLRIISGISQSLKDWLRVVFFKNINEVKVEMLISQTETGGKIYSIDTIENSIVEFDKCYYNEEKNQLRNGRIYFIKQYYSNNELIRKTDAFVSWSEDLLRYIKKNLYLIKEGEFKGFYASKQVIALISKQQLELIKD